jgi:hypothetical protein
LGFGLYARATEQFIINLFSSYKIEQVWGDTIPARLSLHIIIGMLSNKNCLTQRAADGGYAPRFLSVFVALSFFRFGGESTPPTHRS